MHVTSANAIKIAVTLLVTDPASVEFPATAQSASLGDEVRIYLEVGMPRIRSRCLRVLADNSSLR